MPGVARQASRSAPDQTASMRKNRSSGGTAQAINSTQISVSTTFAGDENRLARSQPKAPVAASGGGSFSAGRAAQISERFVAHRRHRRQRSTIAVVRP